MHTEKNLAAESGMQQTMPVVANDVVSLTSNDTRKLLRLQPSTSHLQQVSYYEYGLDTAAFPFASLCQSSTSCQLYN